MVVSQDSNMPCLTQPPRSTNAAVRFPSHEIYLSLYGGLVVPKCQAEYVPCFPYPIQSGAPVYDN